MKPVYLILSLLLVTGCSQWQATKMVVKDASAHAADEALQVVLWKLCKASSIGAINRWIGSNKDLATAYKTVCAQDEQADVIIPDA